MSLPNSLLSEIQALRTKVEQASLPDELLRKVDRELVALERSVELGSYDEKYELVSNYINWALRIPWSRVSTDRLEIAHAQQVFDQHHYGMQEVKDRFLEYIAVLKLRANQAGEAGAAKAPVLLLVGLVGTGKTTFAYSLAEALNRPLVRIPFGGMGSATELRGSSRLRLEAEPGRILKGLVDSQVKNPVFLLDEIDRISEAALVDVMGVLVELLDPAQNHAFVDIYLDYPVDLSQAIFLATANNTTKISTAVLDRLEKISMPSYTDEEKIVIAQRYLLPKLLKEAGLESDQLIIQDTLWPQLVRPLGFDAGIRTLQRTLQNAVRKAARILVEKGYPQVVITQENSKLFMPTY